MCLTTSWALDVVGLGRTTALWTRAVMVRVISITGSGTAWGAQHHKHGEDDIVVGSGMALRDWG
jgi:hypothetical protein